MGDCVTVIVGRDRENQQKRAFLIAPNNCHINKCDEVVSQSGDEYSVLFSASYTDVDGDLYLALKMALGTPIKIIIHKAVSKVEWGDENEDTADTSCDDACRSGSGDGDGSTVHG